MKKGVEQKKRSQAGWASFWHESGYFIVGILEGAWVPFGDSLWDTVWSGNTGNSMLFGSLAVPFWFHFWVHSSASRSVSDVSFWYLLTLGAEAFGVGQGLA